MGPLKVHNKQTIIQACRSGKGGRDERAPLLNHTKPYALNSTPPPLVTSPTQHALVHDVTMGGGRTWFGLGGTPCHLWVLVFFYILFNCQLFFYNQL